MSEGHKYTIFTDLLNAFGVSYFVSGNVATAIYTKKEISDDIDIVVDLPLQRVTEFIRMFVPEQFFIPPKEVLNLEISRSQRGHINILAFKRNYRADIFFPGNDELVAWGFSRLSKVKVGGDLICLAAPEYVIVQKLRYYQEGLQMRHLEDIASILINAGTTIELDLILAWVKRLGLSRIWNKVQLV